MRNFFMWKIAVVALVLMVDVSAFAQDDDEGEDEGPWCDRHDKLVALMMERFPR